MIESSEFRGDGAIFALILAGVRDDFWNARKNSQAFITAKKFLDGGTCKHFICKMCDHANESGWKRRVCHALPRLLGACCIACGHRYDGHVEYEFDWGAWRDLVVGSLGINVPGFVAAVKGGRRA